MLINFNKKFATLNIFFGKLMVCLSGIIESKRKKKVKNERK